jgi:hypothetical protein
MSRWRSVTGLKCGLGICWSLCRLFYCHTSWDNPFFHEERFINGFHRDFPEIFRTFD